MSATMKSRCMERITIPIHKNIQMYLEVFTNVFENFPNVFVFVLKYIEKKVLVFVF